MTKIYMQKSQSADKNDEERDFMFTKEKNVMKELLTDLKQDFKEDVLLEDSLVKTEFYIP